MQSWFSDFSKLLLHSGQVLDCRSIVWVGCCSLIPHFCKTVLLRPWLFFFLVLQQGSKVSILSLSMVSQGLGNAQYSHMPWEPEFPFTHWLLSWNEKLHEALPLLHFKAFIPCQKFDACTAVTNLCNRLH